MKKYIRSDFWDDDEEYTPPAFDEDLVEEIIESVKDKITSKYGRRWHDIQIDIDNDQYSDNRVYFKVYVYDGDKLKLHGYFDFTQYDSYFDEKDYIQHRDVSISDFVNEIGLE